MEESAAAACGGDASLGSALVSALAHPYRGPTAAAAAASAASTLARDFSHAKGLCASTEAASALHEALWALQCLAWHSTVP